MIAMPGSNREGFIEEREAFLDSGFPRNSEGRPKAALASQTKENRDSGESRGFLRTEGGDDGAVSLCL